MPPTRAQVPAPGRGAGSPALTGLVAQRARAGTARLGCTPSGMNGEMGARKLGVTHSQPDLHPLRAAPGHRRHVAPEHRRLAAVVMAAGEGTRMRSSRPKPLHRLCGKPMVLWALDALSALGLSRVVVVVGHGATRMTKALAEARSPGPPLEVVEQPLQRGTGDALSVALTAFSDDDAEMEDLVVLPGDAPLLRPATIEALVEAHRQSAAAATLLTARLEDPTGYGRVVRSRDGRVAAIVEQADATDEQLAIDEVCTSIYAFRRSVLAPALRRVSPDNAQGEYYLTDVIAVLHDAGYPVTSLVARDPVETSGVNDRSQLATAEAVLRSRINHRWMVAGVTMLDPSHTYLDSTVHLEPDVTLFPGTILQGTTKVATGAEIGPATHLTDCTVGARARVRATSAEQVTIGDDAQVGPWAWLPPGTAVPPGSAVGPGGAADSPEGDFQRGTGLEA
jgi:bifunctional UDP-N-acetylglucosamine pyrophosphorylase / glucosamine-1-phosphate N-acetyltransferase